MTQRFSFYEDLSIRENLEFVARLYDLPNVRRTVDETLDSLGLASRQHQLAGTLSGGWKQRLALAACIMHRPRLLLLDEPTAGVDPKARREFWDEIHRLTGEGLTVLVSTHYMDEAERCHRIVYIAYGAIVARGTASEIIGESGLATYVIAGRAGERGGARACRQAGRRAGRRLRPGDPCRRIGPGGAGGERARGAGALRRGGEAGRNDARRRVHPPDEPGASGERPMKAGSAIARIRAVLLKEVIQMRRDRLTFAMIVGIPIIQLVLFGYAINTDPKQLPTGVVMADPGPVARAIVAGMHNSGYYRIAEGLSENEAREGLASGRLAFAVTIPVDFHTDLARGREPQIVVEADATDPAATAGAVAALPEIVNRAVAASADGASARDDGPRVEVVAHRLYNPEAVNTYNIVPGLIGTILTMTTTLMTALALTREIERGTMENLLAMPVRPLEIMIGKIVPYIGLGFLQVAVILAAAFLLFSVPMEGSLTLLLFAVLLFIAANVTLGYTFSTLARTQMQAMQMTFFFFLPSLLLSGFMFPFRGMPVWAQMLGQALPLTHFLRAVRGIMLKGSTLLETLPHLWPVAAFLLIIGTLALLRFRRTLD